MLLAATLSALFAGLVAIVATVAIERFGGRVGGVLASITTITVPASLGFWWQSEASVPILERNGCGTAGYAGKCAIFGGAGAFSSRLRGRAIWRSS